ncbi:hypothetical protein BJ546DRAFT_995500 [Cryomyces antarcticus]
MLSLPLVTPREDHTFSRSPLHIPFRPSSPTDPHHNGQNAQQTQSARDRRTQQHSLDSLRTPHAQLAFDESAITHRKANIRRYGSTWLRPPGVSKTLQTLHDEAAEREEQEAQARREQDVLDLQAAEEERAMMEEVRRTAGQEEGGGGREDHAGERDLDDDVPSAGADDMDYEDIDDDDDDEDGLHDRDLDDSIPSAADAAFLTAGSSPSTSSLLRNSVVPADRDFSQADIDTSLALEDAEISGLLQDARDLGIEAGERDLDDDVPEAGSYQHTDTELEDDSSDAGYPDFEGEMMRSDERQYPASRAAGQPHAHPSIANNTNANTIRLRAGNVRAQHRRDTRGLALDEGSSVLDGSSFLGSSPVLSRRGAGLGLGLGSMGGNAFRDRLMRGRQQPPPPPPPEGEW